MMDGNATFLEDTMPSLIAPAILAPRLRRHAHSLAFLALWVCALWLFAAPDAAFAESRQAPNSRVALDVGPSFQPSDRFSGFVDEASGASFVIVEMPPRAYEELKVIPDSKEALAQQGLTDTARGTLPGRKGDYVYFTGKQTAAGSEFAKFVLIVLENGVTAMISANVPQQAIDEGRFTKAQIEDILTKAAVKDQPGETAELFRFGYLGPFRESFGLMGTSKAYSPSGTMPQPGENRLIMEPMLIVSPSINTNVVIDPKQIATRSFKTFGAFKEQTVKSEQAVEIGGLKGYQIVGEGLDQQSGDKIAINLVLLAGEPNGYYAIVGTVPDADSEKFMSELEKVIASFMPVKP
ncbi:MAG: hypothetical protein HC850_18420 [Rhodomicrobium sp.]|nr:hypothetical protein [Rhodomicrobium sp.]